MGCGGIDREAILSVLLEFGGFVWQKHRFGRNLGVSGRAGGVAELAFGWVLGGSRVAFEWLSNGSQWLSMAFDLGCFLVFCWSWAGFGLEKINFSGIRAGFRARGGLTGETGRDIRVRELHTTTVCTPGWRMIFSFDDSNGNKGEKSTITRITGGRKSLVSRRDAEGAEGLARLACEARRNLRQG